MAKLGEARPDFRSTNLRKKLESLLSNQKAKSKGKIKLVDKKQ